MKLSIISSKYIRENIGLVYLLLASLCTGLGNSLESISTLAILQSFFLLLGFYSLSIRSTSQSASSASDITRKPILNRRTSIAIFSTTILLAFGTVLGFSSVFSDSSTTIESVLITYALGLMIWLMVALLALFPQYFYSTKLPKCPLTLWIYPSGISLIYHSIIGRTLSTFPSLANAVIDYEPLRQTVSLFGLIIIEFITAYLCNLVYHYMIYSPTLLFGIPVSYHILANPSAFKRVKKITWYSVWMILVLFITTSFIFVSSRFYQQSVDTLIVPYVPMSCLFGQGITNGTYDWNELWTLTEQRLAAGDALVLWSEESINIYSNEQEESVLTQASNIAKQYGTGYIGITYLLRIDGTTTTNTNQFALISPTGTIAWNYKKSHPVPFVESSITPGPDILPTYEDQTNVLHKLRLGGSICFDLDYPSYMIQSSFKHIDLFFQPSWTWNALDRRHFEGDAIRAIENGFTLFRCSSNGESGVVSNQGVFQSRRYSLDSPTNGAMVFQVPLQPRRPTLYGVFGYLFEYFNMVFLSLMIFQLIVIEYCLLSSPSNTPTYLLSDTTSNTMIHRMRVYVDNLIYKYGPDRNHRDISISMERASSINKVVPTYQIILENEEEQDQQQYQSSSNTSYS